jgi:peptidoglycan/xylan/chitin deacetylase (PgdA/CDA1 family)
MKLMTKIWHKLMKMRLQPIHVFAFHHVSETLDPLVCQEDDWTQLDQFMRNIEKLQTQYKFISLSDAYDKLCHDTMRLSHYAVLTADDGLASVLNIIPWLEEKKIPLTLFVNTRFMEGDVLKPIHKRWLHEIAPDADEKEIARKMYLSKSQLFALTSSYIEVGMHGHRHLYIPAATEEQFEEDLNMCMQILQKHPRFIPAYAYPWGDETIESLHYMDAHGIVPVVLNALGNYKYDNYIDRECIDNKVF